MIAVNTYTYGLIHSALGPLPVAIDGDSHAQHFPVRIVSRLLGVGEERQVEIVKEFWPDALRTIQMELEVGWRPVLCIARKEFALWIGAINPKRCKLETRETLDAYRAALLDAADTLFWQHVAHAGAQIKPVPSSDARLTVVVEGVVYCEHGSPHRLVTRDGLVYLELVEDNNERL